MAVECRRSRTLDLAPGGHAAHRTSRYTAARPEAGLLSTPRPGFHQTAAAWHTGSCALKMSDKDGLACLLPAWRATCTAAGALSLLPSTSAAAVSVFFSSSELLLSTSFLLKLWTHTSVAHLLFSAAVARAAHVAADASAALARVATAAHAITLAAALDFFAHSDLRV